MVQFQDSKTLKYIQTQACPLLEDKYSQYVPNRPNKINPCITAHLHVIPLHGILLALTPLAGRIPLFHVGR